MAGKKTRDADVKVRVTEAVRAQLEALANAREEGLSVILREAIKEYLERKATESWLVNEGRAGGTKYELRRVSKKP
jgi:predicted transcriptional regulator